MQKTWHTKLINAIAFNHVRSIQLNLYEYRYLNGLFTSTTFASLGKCLRHLYGEISYLTQSVSSAVLDRMVAHFVSESPTRNIRIGGLVLRAPERYQPGPAAKAPPTRRQPECFYKMCASSGSVFVLHPGTDIFIKPNESCVKCLSLQ